MYKEIIKPAITLFLVCVIITGALAVVNGVTKPIIEERDKAALQKSLSVVLPGAGSFSDAVDRGTLISRGYQPGETIKNLYEAEAGGETVGYVVEVTPRGYGGAIRILVGIDRDLSVTGVRILSHSETPGLGSKAQDQTYLEQYLGTIPENLYHVVKTAPSQDGDIAALSGATVTSRAVSNGISEAASLVRSLVKGGE
ncbi:MAG TPA: RnfABCDGE type electron transport complex subunit G [Thermoclostridium caenicola]|nr:RnfABCDGE type electron transport complex subunit G [Thermoclostridium caenicola]